MRLQQYMASCGVASRRASEQLIVEGRVAVNGIPAELGQKIDPDVDQVTLDSRPVATEKKVYVLLNKPRGVITTAKDTHERKTVLDCIAKAGARIFPVGRLDMDVEGVLLLTNDGDLAYRLTHPKHEIERVYHVWVRGTVTDVALRRLREGVQLDDGITAPAKAELMSSSSKGSFIKLGLHEGRKREVKRMCEGVGHPVIELKRVAYGPLEVKGLKTGEWRHLDAKEVAGLLRFVGLE